MLRAPNKQLSLNWAICTSQANSVLAEVSNRPKWSLSQWPESRILDFLLKLREEGRLLANADYNCTLAKEEVPLLVAVGGEDGWRVLFFLISKRSWDPLLSKNVLIIPSANCSSKLTTSILGQYEPSEHGVSSRYRDRTLPNARDSIAHHKWQMLFTCRCEIIQNPDFCCDLYIHLESASHFPIDHSTRNSIL